MSDTGQIYGKMAAILKEVEAIGKNARNETQKFNYRGIDDVYNALNPLLAKHGVFMTAQVLGKSREERTNKNGTVLAFTTLHMRYRFYADDGSSVETEAEGEGMDSGDKSSNKAMAVAHKYALLQAFCIPTKDIDDPDAEGHEVTPTDRRPPPQEHQERPSDESVKAKAWGEDAIRYVNRTGDSAKFKAWHDRNLQTIARLSELHPEIHKRLLVAISGREDAFAAAREA
jgi:hypothetical protein